MTAALRIAAVLATLGLALAPSAALAGHGRPSVVHCGQVITRDTTLANDLVNCPATALTIGADGVTLDLAGHLVDGTNAPGSEGIAVDGHAGVEIQDGTVREFRFNGIALRNARHAEVERVSVRQIGAGGLEGEDVSAGIFAEGSDDLEIHGSRVSNDVVAWQADGIVLLSSKRADVTGNDSSRNAFNGIVIVQSPWSHVGRNRVDSNENSGILVFDSPGVLVEGNEATRQTNPDTAGIIVISSTRDLVVGNRASGNTLGIDLEGGTTATQVLGNVVRGGVDGIGVLDSSGNTVAGNDVRDVGGVGVLLDEFFLAEGADDNTVARNAVLGSGDAGFLVAGDSTGNRLDRNLANGNGADGIHIDTAGNRLGGSTANRNAGHGIAAVAGTTDAGGNHASGNALSPQCTGVSCTA